MKKLKLKLQYLNKEGLMEVEIDTLYTDLYYYNEDTHEWDEDQINYEWIEYLASQKIDTSNHYLDSYSITPLTN